MLTSGDVVGVDLGIPVGREAGFRHPAVVVTAQRVLDAEPSVVQVVPLTSMIRSFQSEVTIDAGDRTGLERTSAAQCHQIRALSTARIGEVLGNVGPTAIAQIREILGILLDIAAQL
jgi:mRNA interferase MazF